MDLGTCKTFNGLFSIHCTIKAWGTKTCPSEILLLNLCSKYLTFCFGAWEIVSKILSRGLKGMKTYKLRFGAPSFHMPSKWNLHGIGYVGSENQTRQLKYGICKQSWITMIVIWHMDNMCSCLWFFFFFFLFFFKKKNLFYPNFKQLQRTNL